MSKIGKGWEKRHLIQYLFVQKVIWWSTPTKWQQISILPPVQGFFLWIQYYLKNILGKIIQHLAMKMRVNFPKSLLGDLSSRLYENNILYKSKKGSITSASLGQSISLFQFFWRNNAAGKFPCIFHFARSFFLSSSSNPRQFFGLSISRFFSWKLFKAGEISIFCGWKSFQE